MRTFAKYAFPFLMAALIIIAASFILLGLASAKTDPRIELQNKEQFLIQRTAESVQEVAQLRQEYDEYDRYVQMRDSVAKQIKAIEETNAIREAELAIIRSQLDFLAEGMAR